MFRVGGRFPTPQQSAAAGHGVRRQWRRPGREAGKTEPPDRKADQTRDARTPVGLCPPPTQGLDPSLPTLIPVGDPSLSEEPFCSPLLPQ